MNIYKAIHQGPYGLTMKCIVKANSKSEAITILTSELLNNKEHYEIISIKKA